MIPLVITTNQGYVQRMTGAQHVFLAQLKWIGATASWVAAIVMTVLVAVDSERVVYLAFVIVCSQLGLGFTLCIVISHYHADTTRLAAEMAEHLGTAVGRTVSRDLRSVA